MRRWLIWLPISVGLLALLVWRTRPWEAAALAGRLDAVPLMAAIGLNALVIAAWAVRSAGLMGAVAYPLTLRQLVPVVSFANTVNNLTPASSGEVLRAVILKRRYGVPYERSTAVILAERFWAILIMLATALAASAGTLVAAGPPAVAAAWLAAAVAVVAPSLAYRLGIRPGRVAERIASRAGRVPARLRSVAERLAAVDDLLTSIVTSPRQAAAFIASTLAIFALFAAQLWLVLAALGSPLSPLGVWAALGLSIVAGVISALPFGLGAADVVLVLLLGAQGLAPTEAGAAALLLRVTATLPLGIVGTASWLQLTGGQRIPLEEARGPDEPIRARVP
jgi:glycosyltransferase 2 family protein